MKRHGHILIVRSALVFITKFHFGICFTVILFAKLILRRQFLILSSGKEMGQISLDLGEVIR